MYIITKDFAFSASHQLLGLPADHQCARLHGHNYVVRVELASDTLDKWGMVLDFGELAPFKAWLDNHLDHRHLNDVVPARLALSPTAELLAEYLAGILQAMLDLPDGCTVAVGVQETDKCWAWWRP